eukprot:SAG31_NODE_728_length_12522_cov_13.320534_9_plen_95_part_00
MLLKKVAEMEAKQPAESSGKTYDETEPILAENPGRFVIFPIKHPQVWKMVRRPAQAPPRRATSLRRCVVAAPPAKTCPLTRTLAGVLTPAVQAS